ncbi:cation diffusion facilitator family transporter [Desulfosporosinus orientis DSM 765]|uniref:Cation diffusion facilitator family transporter n=1 Tax=Desulfosporosinus orientis (strain ATCC 19365 / DSM 765 / NCIMB 8382 / VKM B-1628 / Singapore I) TaxID=768706 RepID=G7W900_DESOD|nr:cation diffusion facilitator family transporter [Desulfosporosinus orientis]AET68209.1 cation diffusion facilitator family transporter [Desulfosporosinus orientis DSM 765]
MDDYSLGQSQKRLLISITLVGIILVVKICFALFTKSLALLSDSWHLMTDFSALIISWWGLKIGSKRPDYKNTYGYYRYGVLTALINNVSLIAVSLLIFYKAIDRFFHPITVEPQGMIFVAIVGMIVNIAIVLNLKKNTNNLNVKSAFLHFVGDALADLGVLIGGIVIFFTGWSNIDTLLSAGLACLILRSALKMTRECLIIFLESVPEDISIQQLRSSILEIKGVKGVSDIHVWSISKEIKSMTAHVWVHDVSKEQSSELLHSIQHTIFDKFGISHSTIQFEYWSCGSCYHNKEDHPKHCSLCIDCAQQVIA